jgi:23S rRNA (cytidine1920-2'-O)/16S rRNA (cytidine1409-2'-O)-methyltransferase
VKDERDHAEVERRLRWACANTGLVVRDWFASVIAGGDGNREFFIHAAAAAAERAPT